MRRGKKSFKVQFLRWWVRDRELTPLERNSSKVGYMGAGFLMAGQWTLEPVLFIVGFLGSLTTFSTFAFDNYNLLNLRSYYYLFANLILSNFIGIIMVIIGTRTIKLIN